MARRTANNKAFSYRIRSQINRMARKGDARITRAFAPRLCATPRGACAVRGDAKAHMLRRYIAKINKIARKAIQ